MKKYVLFCFDIWIRSFGQSQRPDFEPKKLFFKIEDEVEIVKQVLLNNRKLEIDETNF